MKTDVRLDTIGSTSGVAMFEVQRPNGRRLFENLHPDEIVTRYRENYGLGPEIGIDEVRLHADLEANLTDRLISAPLSERGSIFEQAYSELYNKLPWLASVRTANCFESWSKLMKPHSKVYEIGSGTGALAEYLARMGFDCTATEITQERGEKFVSTVGGLRWRRTDGVHLDQFEEPESYDHIISDRVVEHLHPQDLNHTLSNGANTSKTGAVILSERRIGGTGRTISLVSSN